MTERIGTTEPATVKQVIHRQRRTHLDALSSNQRARLRRLNEQLSALEFTLLAEGRRVDAELRNRLLDPSDPLFDYEMEAVVLLHLRPEDRDYRKGAPNWLGRRRYGLKGVSSDESLWGLGDGENHNDFAHRDYPLQGEHHCWIYHDLYDHGYGQEAPDWILGWGDLLRIGAVSWRMEIMQQYCPNWAPGEPFWTDLPQAFGPLPASVRALDDYVPAIMTSTLVILDFETTGMSPESGARVTEIGMVRIRNGHITERYQSLMNAGVRIPRFIEAFTGITNRMMKGAPPADRVMREAAEFIGDDPLVAHNASFDRRFLDAEWHRIRHTRRQEFACTLLLSRRIYPDAPNHQLGTLVRHLNLPAAERAHRALADAEMTAHLLLALLGSIEDRFGVDPVSHALLRAIQGAPKHHLARIIAGHAKPERR